MKRFKARSRWTYSLTGLFLLFAAPVVAEVATNFGTRSLSPGFSRENGAIALEGYTQGSFSLPSIANRDQSGNFCLGYGAASPDHILDLQDQFDQLTIQVDSGGRDTTLLIQGPNSSTVYCGDNTGSSKDASIQHTNWPAGVYRVWVGSFDQGGRYNYTLRLQEN